MSIFFKDIGKKAKDLLGKKYTTDGSKTFSVETTTSDDVKYAAEGTLTGAKVNGKVSVDFKADRVHFKKLSVDSSGCFTSEVTLSNVVDNVLFTMSGKSRSLTDHEGDIGAEYSHKDFKAKFVAAPFCKNTADASICYKHNDVFVGGSAGINFNNGFDLSAYNVGVGYTFDQNVVALNFNQKKTLKFSGHRQHSDDIALATTLSSSLSDDNICPAIEFGGSYKIDSDTSVFCKLSSPRCSGTEGLRGSVALDQKLNDNASFSVTAELDLDPAETPSDFLGGEFGLTFKFA